MALRFGSREVLALLVVGAVSIGAIGAASAGAAAVAIGIGLLLAAVGRDPILGIPRFDAGLTVLQDGVGLVPLLVGMFAVSEVMVRYSATGRGAGTPAPTGAPLDDGRVGGGSSRVPAAEDRLTLREWLGTWRETGTGTLIGTLLGALPGPGATLATFASYGVASRFRRNRGRFGTGVIEGVAAAESGNSATSGATLIPLFGLGAPGDALAAMIAAALSLQGLAPGPSLARAHGDVVIAFFVLLMVGSLANLVLGRALSEVFLRIARVPGPSLLPALTLVPVLGVYTLANSVDAVAVTALAGVLGYALRRWGIPPSVVVIAYVIGPLVEVNLRRALILADGDPVYLVRSPIAASAFLLAGVLLLYLRRNARGDAERDPGSHVPRRSLRRRGPRP